MEKRLNPGDVYRTALFVLIVSIVSGVAFVLGLGWASSSAHAAEVSSQSSKKPRVVYPKSAKVDLEADEIQGELRNPGELYFQRKPEEKFDSLVKRRPNFHREMLRDVVAGK